MMATAMTMTTNNRRLHHNASGAPQVRLVRVVTAGCVLTEFGELVATNRRGPLTRWPTKLGNNA